MLLEEDVQLQLLLLLLLRQLGHRLCRRWRQHHLRLSRLSRLRGQLLSRQRDRLNRLRWQRLLRL